MIVLVNDTATTEICTLSLHDALPITCSTTGQASGGSPTERALRRCTWPRSELYETGFGEGGPRQPSPHHGTSPNPPACAGKEDRKSTRLNSSHANISYAAFCLKTNQG